MMIIGLGRNARADRLRHRKRRCPGGSYGPSGQVKRRVAGGHVDRVKLRIAAATAANSPRSLGVKVVKKTTELKTSDDANTFSLLPIGTYQPWVIVPVPELRLVKFDSVKPSHWSSSVFSLMP